MSANLEVLFSSAARVDVLRLFLLNPDRQFYQHEIERETGQPIRAVQREAKRLAEIGLVSSSKEGNRLFYGLNPDFSLLAELTALFRKDAGVEATAQAADTERTLPPEPSTIRQPFAWMETLPVPPPPDEMRKRQVEGEWDRAY